MQGHAFAGEFTTPAQDHVHGFRGRMDERIDLVRSVTDGRFVYLRNYMPHLSQGQRVEAQIRLRHSSTHAWRKLYDAGKLNKKQSLFWETPKAPEELYDLQNDPDEVDNLANSPDHQDVLVSLREAHRAHAMRIADVGFIPEVLRSRLPVPPYDFGHNESLYPVGRIVDTADLASMLHADAVPELAHRMGDPDDVVRYWAAMGMVMRGSPAVAQSQTELLNSLQDPVPDVRIAAAWALAKHGGPEVADEGLTTLAHYASRDHNSALVSLAALTAIDDCGDRATSLKDDFPTWLTSGEVKAGRYEAYPSRLMKSIEIRFKLPIAKQGRRRKSSGR